MFAERHPDWRVTIAEAPAGQWRKGCAVNRAARESTADTIVMCDADVWTTGLGRAVEHVQDGAPWAIPHHLVHRLTEACTRRLIAGEDPELEHDEPPYRGVQGGGIVVLPRLTLLEVPVDERFAGWGQEDMSHAIALHVLAGPAVRGTADLLHLWHPPQPRMSRKTGNHDGQLLHRRYLRARRDRDEMRALIREAHRDAYQSAEPIVRH